jgi:hypothetical protein
MTNLLKLRHMASCGCGCGVENAVYSAWLLKGWDEDDVQEKVLSKEAQSFIW